MTAAIEFETVTRAYGPMRAVDGVSFSVKPGEFFAMLGPSGSGKTTCLRLIAGFEIPDAGRVLLGGDDVTFVPPYARDVNTVFQDYALFPHMSVLQNVAYGLKVRKVPQVERERRAREMLALVQLEVMADRGPAQLSGGQRQRVALARALINQPKVLLLDEPLGALDLKLREEMQIELKNLQRRMGITFVFVTHDQGEALSMADRIAVFNQGRIEQLAAPQELYRRPETPFVARFVGSANVAEGELAQRLAGSAQPFAIRAEHIRLLPAGQSGAGDMGCDGEVIDVQYHGATHRWQVRLDGGPMFAASRADGERGWQPVAGNRVRLEWERKDVVMLRAEPST